MRKRKDFCKWGHSITLVGRHENGGCNECRRVYVTLNNEKLRNLRLERLLQRTKEMQERRQKRQFEEAKWVVKNKEWLEQERKRRS